MNSHSVEPDATLTPGSIDTPLIHSYIIINQHFNMTLCVCGCVCVQLRRSNFLIIDQYISGKCPLAHMSDINTIHLHGGCYMDAAWDTMVVLILVYFFYFFLVEGFVQFLDT